MKLKLVGTIVVLIASIIISPSVYAAATVEILMEQTEFKYCEKLFYIIKVSEITGENAIIHIRDEFGTTSSAIPIPINNFENPIPSLVPFEKEIFLLGKYFIDVEYSGVKNSVEFDLIDSNNVCIPAWIKQLAYYWINGQISDISFSDGIKFLIEKDIIIIPKTTTDTTKIETKIPTWVKTSTQWWIDEKISDNEFAQAIQYLIGTGIIEI